MAGYFSMKMKMKRKDLEEVSDEFSYFSLSSPATKIRRLDAELPQIMEEEEPKVPLVYGQQVGHEMRLPSYMEQVGGSSQQIEELPSISNSEERAIVLFKPMITPLLLSPSNFSVTVNSDVMSGIKNQFFWTTRSSAINAVENEAARQDSNNRAPNECLSVVPWVPSQTPQTSGTEVPQAIVSELMESEDMGDATMDIEESDIVAKPGQGSGFSGMSEEGLHQWQQLHCMIPQIPQNTPTSVFWFR